MQPESGSPRGPLSIAASIIAILAQCAVRWRTYGPWIVASLIA